MEVSVNVPTSPALADISTTDILEACLEQNREDVW